MGPQFGSDVAALEIYLGETRLDSAAITAVADTQITFTMPELFFGGVSVSLPVTVTRLDQGSLNDTDQASLSDTEYGAICDLASD